MNARIIMYSVVCIVLFAVCIVEVLIPPFLPDHSVIFLLTDKQVQNTNSLVSVVISNTSDVALTYRPEFVKAAVLRNRTWETNFVTAEARDVIALQNPGEAVKFADINPIPQDASAIKFGLSYTSFTWRGHFAWKIPTDSVFSPLSDFLIQLDMSKRSKTEWSQPFLFNANSNVLGK